MKRILVVSDHRISVDLLRDELARQSLEQDLEVFLLCSLPGSAVRNLVRRKRFWSARHAELHADLDELMSMGVLSDGLVAITDPLDSVHKTLWALRPEQVIVVSARSGRYEDGCRRALALYGVESERQLETTWLST